MKCAVIINLKFEGTYFVCVKKYLCMYVTMLERKYIYVLKVYAAATETKAVVAVIINLCKH